MKTFESISDLPLHRWRKINETNDLSYLIVKPNVTPPLKEQRLLPALWDKIYCEFLDTFGINDDFKNILEIQRDILVLKMQMAIDGDRFHLNFIKMKEQEIKDLQGEGGTSNNFNETKARISKFMGFAINENETTVKDFYTYVELFKQDNKQRAA